MRGSSSLRAPMWRADTIMAGGVRFRNWLHASRDATPLRRTSSVPPASLSFCPRVPFRGSGCVPVSLPLSIKYYLLSVYTLTERETTLSLSLSFIVVTKFRSLPQLQRKRIFKPYSKCIFQTRVTQWKTAIRWDPNVDFASARCPITLDTSLDCSRGQTQGFRILANKFQKRWKARSKSHEVGSLLLSRPSAKFTAFSRYTRIPAAFPLIIERPSPVESEERFLVKDWRICLVGYIFVEILDGFL